MTDNAQDFTITRLGKCRIPSPMKDTPFVGDDAHVLYHSTIHDVCGLSEGGDPLTFEMAGPREKIYFDPSKLKAGIVTCGGLCPGLNDVIRAIVLSLFHHYGVRSVFGFRYGYEGLSPRHAHTPLELTPQLVGDLHEKGGTILGSSRGPQDVAEMVDTIDQMNVGLFFAIGGDGTLRGAHAISEEIGKRGLKIGVIGIHKTIDNDISYVQQSFGFATAVTETRTAIYSAHNEALGARNGIGLVKLMGRHSGFIAAYATLANSVVNFCLVPEVPFGLDAFLDALEERLERRGHAVIVVGEGAGQELIAKDKELDASGNVLLGDIGFFLKDRINDFFKKKGIEAVLKYIDPSYTIRSLPANAQDSVFCLLLGHNAVHAGMTGRTDMVVGHWKEQFTHVPVRLTISGRKQIDPGGRLWAGVQASTGQHRNLL
ncbi:MAG: ATP-dependent 6-phosphofructokinase [Deltaproteobacteria bacterium]|nr:ATP-dependent 6-phosphofructokinase [Deltaproteobacteria bacterium]